MSTKDVVTLRPSPYRNSPGCKREEWCNWPWCAFEDIDSTLNVQQWIQQCIHRDHKDIDTALECPKGVEEGVWKYEHLRQFCLELNGLAVLLQDECRPETCTQMTATDQWIFLCAAHKNPKECSAIDYTRHTLDGAASLLNSNRYFSSRVTIKESSISKIGSICRRIYRIFSHAYFHHKKTIFDPFEAETHLCKRFTTYVMRYDLMSQEHLIVPILSDQIAAAAAGLSPATAGGDSSSASSSPNTSMTTAGGGHRPVPIATTTP